MPKQKDRFIIQILVVFIRQIKTSFLFQFWITGRRALLLIKWSLGKHVSWRKENIKSHEFTWHTNKTDLLPKWRLVIWPIDVAPLLDTRQVTSLTSGYLFDNLNPALPVNLYHLPARRSSASLFPRSWVKRLSLSASFSSLYDEHGSLAIKIDILTCSDDRSRNIIIFL